MGVVLGRLGVATDRDLRVLLAGGEVAETDVAPKLLDGLPLFREIVIVCPKFF